MCQFRQALSSWRRGSNPILPLIKRLLAPASLARVALPTGIEPASPGRRPGSLARCFREQLRSRANGGSCTPVSGMSRRHSPVELRSLICVVPPGGLEPPVSAFVARRPFQSDRGGVVRPAGLEPARTRLEDELSIQRTRAHGVPTGIRTLVSALRGRRPCPASRWGQTSWHQGQVSNLRWGA